MTDYSNIKIDKFVFDFLGMKARKEVELVTNYYPPITTKKSIAVSQYLLQDGPDGLQLVLIDGRIRPRVSLDLDFLSETHHKQLLMLWADYTFERDVLRG